MRTISPSADPSTVISFYRSALINAKNNGKPMLPAMSNIVNFLHGEGVTVPSFLGPPTRIVEVKNSDVRKWLPADVVHQAHLHAEAWLEREDTVWLTMLHGCPGSGKSTLAQTQLRPRGVLLDACNLNKWDRMQLVKMARKHGAKSECVCVDVPWETAFERNSTRPEQDRIPLKILERLYLEATSKPTKREGFVDVRALSGE